MQPRSARVLATTQRVCGALVLAMLLGGCSSCGSGANELTEERPRVLDAGPPAALDAGIDAGGDAGADAGTNAGPPDAGRRVVLPVSRRDHFFTHADAPLRHALAHEELAEVERGTGGRSLAFRITLADGTRGYFKPEQSFTGMRWYSEIAAYHLDRELRLGRVAPVVGRSLRWSALEEAAGDDPRIEELRVGEDGEIRGAFIWWVPERLVPLELPEGWERWLRVEGAPAPRTPFQRPGEYRRATRVRAPEPELAPGVQQEDPLVPEPDLAQRPAELSDMIVFDYLTHNLDRWGTNNTNVRTVGRNGPLMFLDNAAAFVLRNARVPQLDERLHAVQRFRRSTIDAVRRFDMERLLARLAADPLAPELDERQRRNLEERRAHLLAYVDALIEAHGEDLVYPW